MTEQEIIKLYQEGKSITFLAENSSYNYRQVRKIISESGIPIRGGRKKKQLSEEQLNILKQRYCEESEDLCVLAKEFNWDKETLRNLINELGLKKRTNNRINKRIKSDYFSIIDNSNKAYILGLLFTDGCVDKKPNGQGRVRLQLQARDKDILEKIRNELQIDTQLILDPRGNKCYSLEFCDNQIFEDLQKYNIIPNKTYDITHLPTNIPKKFLKDYIRGLIDGDGGISVSDNLSTDVTLHFTTFHKSIAEDFQKLIDLEILNKENSNTLFFTTAWHVQWRGYNQVLQILDSIYKDAELYIDRKYEIYIRMLNRN